MRDDDWQAGDDALCVIGGWSSRSMTLSPCNKEYPIKGRIYKVAEPIFDQLYSDLFLLLEDGPDNRGWGPYWGASRFIKITPSEATTEDQEIIDIMKRTPQTEDA